MFQQLVVVKVTVVAKLAEWMPFVTGVVWISMRSVAGQFLTVVPLTLVGEDLAGEVEFKERGTD